MKHKILGVCQILLGLLQIAVPYAQLTFTGKKILEMYESFGAPPPSYTAVYVLAGLLVAMGVINVIWGLYLLITKNSSDKLFMMSVGYAVMSFIIGGILIAALVMALLYPMYNISSVM